jgi:hypothetical protein
METELERSASIRLAQKALSLIAVIFGLVTIFAGTRVLIGTDPGYIVFLPLLLYNTVMGVVYIAAGITMWVNLNRGKYAAAAIFGFNIFVLGIIGYLYMEESSIAIESVRAMTFRTIVWFVLFLGLTWVYRSKTLVEEQHA